MNVPSSTSSSRLAAAAFDATTVVAAALVLALAFVAAMEWRLAQRGFLPTAVDSEELWLQERQRAAALGDRALILLGASRIQLDTDLDVLRRRTGLVPVQLAIDGSAFMPVLEGLAADPDVTGTVIVDVADKPLAIPPSGTDAGAVYAADYARMPPRRGIDFHWAEARLGQLARLHLRSYADGARPVTSFLLRVLPSNEAPQYLVTLPDRSRLADYTRVPMPAFYLARAARNAGLAGPPPARDADDLVRKLRAHIATLRPKDNAAYLREVDRLLRASAAIEARGGHVRFVAMPTSGLVREAESAFFPRAEFYDRLAARAGGRALHSADVPALARFQCPDGSHLDYRDRAAFTEALVDALGLGRAR
jgi:hypothetical protein